MRAHGATVVAQEDPDLVNTMLNLGVPADAFSCHVALIDGYVITGHVPAEAVSTLLNQKLDVVGLVVPAMPEKAPGMGGTQEDWMELDVYLISHDGQVSIFDF